jgi:hypothetical protein
MNFKNQNYGRMKMKKKKAKRKVIYYAHPMEMYGTSQEAMDERLMKRLFPGYDVYNPNNPHAQLMADLHGMDFFIRKVKECDLVVFRSIEEPEGVKDVGAGVSKEVLTAYDSMIPVVEIPWGYKMWARTMSVEATRKHIRRVKGERA